MKFIVGDFILSQEVDHVSGSSSRVSSTDAKHTQLAYQSDLFLELSYFSVLSPYYTEEVLFSSDDLDKQNEDGVSILFYLQKIYPGLFVNLEFQDVVT